MTVGQEAELAKTYDFLKEKSKLLSPDFEFQILRLTKKESESTSNAIKSCIENQDYYMYSGHGNGF
jgi:hypothetical protein